MKAADLLKRHVVEGQVVQMARSGDQYVVRNIHDTPHGQRATLERARPKPKGKAARKAAKKARRALWQR